MSDHSRTFDEVKSLLQACIGVDSQQIIKFYNSWAESYDQGMDMTNYRAPNLVVDFFNDNFSGNCQEALVLDVACGSGLVAKQMAERGFRHFVGVDGSKGMLEQAAKTGLYKDLKLALLGTDPLPAQTGVFDVVIMVGALNPGFVPVSVVRELCATAKPGGFICMSRGHRREIGGEEYEKDLERELQLMEEEGLWSPVGRKEVDRYMRQITVNTERDKNQDQEECFISGRCSRNLSVKISQCDAAEVM